MGVDPLEATLEADGMASAVASRLDARFEKCARDAASPVARHDIQVGDPGFRGRVVQPSTNDEADDARDLAVPLCNQDLSVGMVEIRVVDRGCSLVSRETRGASELR